MNFESTSGWKRGIVYVQGENSEKSVEYFEVGDPSSPRLLFVHGWGLSPISYRAPINALANDGWYVLAPSLPGFGHSSTTPKHGNGGQILRRFASRISAALDEIDRPRGIPVVGHSMGAGIATLLEASDPHLASSLTLICPIGGTGSHATSWGSMLMSLHKEIGIDTPRRIKDAGLDLLRHPVTHASAGIAAKHADLIDSFVGIAAQSAPVHIVLASEDSIIAREKLPQLKGAEEVLITEVPGTHGWLLQRPWEVPALVEQSELLAARRKARISGTR